MSDLRILAEIFLVTYSILYGIMLNSCSEQNLFPYGQICRNKRALRRICFSLLFVNVIPFVIFAYIFVFLNGITSQPNCYNVIGFFLSQ